MSLRRNSCKVRGVWEGLEKRTSRTAVRKILVEVPSGIAYNVYRDSTNSIKDFTNLLSFNICNSRRRVFLGESIPPRKIIYNIILLFSSYYYLSLFYLIIWYLFIILIFIICLSSRLFFLGGSVPGSAGIVRWYRPVLSALRLKCSTYYRIYAHIVIPAKNIKFQGWTNAFPWRRSSV